MDIYHTQLINLLVQRYQWSITIPLNSEIQTPPAIWTKFFRLEEFKIIGVTVHTIIKFSSPELRSDWGQAPIHLKTFTNICNNRCITV